MLGGLAGWKLNPATGQLEPPKAPEPAPAPTSQPAPTPTPAQPPASTPAPTPADNWQSDFSQASDIANNMLQGNEHARISDPYEQQRQEYVNYLQGRLGGLDSGEQRAMKEEGLAGLDQQTAQNLERYGSIAGANGVQGGARAGLMGRALHENNLGRAQLERQFVMDNIAIKDKAAQAYGGALNDASNIALGVGKYNAGAQDADTGIKLSLPFQIMNGIGGYKSEDKANDLTQQGIDIARDLAGGGGTSGNTTTSTSTTGEPGRNEVGKQDQTSIDKLTSQLNDIGAQVGAQDKPDTGLIDSAYAALKERVELMYGDETEAEKKRRFELEWKEWLWNAGVTDKDGKVRVSRGGWGF